MAASALTEQKSVARTQGPTLANTTGAAVRAGPGLIDPTARTASGGW